MGSDIPQRKALRFLREHLHSQEPFTKAELADTTGWNKPGTFNTYWSKQLKPFVVEIGGDKFRVRTLRETSLPSAGLLVILEV